MAIMTEGLIVFDQDAATVLAGLGIVGVAFAVALFSVVSDRVSQPENQENPDAAPAFVSASFY
jgi:hypothetical protein